MATLKQACSSQAPIDWSGVPLHRVEVSARQTIFSQGDPATSVIYLERGTVRLSVLSRGGREAVIAVLEQHCFFGEGCLVGQRHRMATALALLPSTILIVEKQDMVRHLATSPPLAGKFLMHVLTRNIRIQEDLLDQLFNSSEKRLARTLLLLAHHGDTNASDRLLPKLSQQTLAEMVGTTRSRVNFFMNRFRKLGFIDYKGGLTVKDSLLTVVLRD